MRFIPLPLRDLRSGCTLVALAVAPVVGASEVSISAFLDQARVGNVKISPTGEYIAVTLRADGKARFRVMTHPGWEVKYDLFLGDEREVSEMQWVQDELVLVSLGRRLLRLDVTVPTGELRSIDIETGKIRILPSGGVLDALPNDPDHVLVINAAGRFTQVNRLNVYTGHTQRIAQSANPGGGFVSNAEGEVVFTTGQNEANETQVHYRRKRERWRLVESFPYGVEGWRPAWHGPRADSYFTWDNRGGSSTTGLGLYDAVSGEHKMVIRQPKVDITYTMFDFNRRPYGVRFDHHFPAVQYLNPKHPLAQQHAGVSKAHPEDHVRFTSFPRDHSRTVALIAGDRKPGAFVLVDFKAKRVTPLVTRKASLPREALSAMQPVELQVRDGATVYGYVTSHANTETPGPMVVLVHGGPHGVRDYWGFNGEVQLLANRGFTCAAGELPRFRRVRRSLRARRVRRMGSADAGRRDRRHPLGDTDPSRRPRPGVHHGRQLRRILRANGRRARAGFVPLRDRPSRRLRSDADGKKGDIRRRRSGVRYIREVIGDNVEELKARSPSHNAQRIRAAVMLVHGGRDLRTPLAHGHAMRDALEKAGKPVEWVFESAQGHGFAGNAARAELYERILAFLNTHIGEQPAAPPPA